MPAAGRVCGLEQGPAGCPEAAFARGLCRRHYRRAARATPAAATDPVVGVTVSGTGRWGVLATDSDGRLGCHECGQFLPNLAVHVGMVHAGP